MSRIAYYRVSTEGQSIEAQRKALGGSFDREFSDEGVSGATLAAERPGFGQLLSYIREGDTLYVYALDRLGRDALDVQSTVRKLLQMNVTLDVLGLGPIGRGVGELIVAVLAQIADMERGRIKERCDAGREAAKASLAATGKTHRGKASLGRPMAADAREVAKWRKANNASISQTMGRFGLSKATVSRYCAAEQIEAQIANRNEMLGCLESGKLHVGDGPALRGPGDRTQARIDDLRRRNAEDEALLRTFRD